MSEMQGIEQKQAETTKGIAETTAAIKDMSSKNEESNTGIKAGLNAIVKAGLVTSKADRIARKATQRAAIDAAARYAEMQKLAAEGNASAEDLAAAQEVAAKTAAEAAEAAEKQSMLDRFGDDEAPDVGPGADPKKTGGTIKKLGKKLGGLALLLLGLLGLLLNTPAFKVISKALDDLIDWFASPDNPLTKFFKSIIDGFGDLFKGNFKEGFAKIGKALDDGITAAVKSIFGVEFEGNVSDVLKKFVGKFIRGIANLLPENSIFGSLRDKLLNVADELDPEEAERRRKLAAANKAELDRLDIEGEDEEVLAVEQQRELEKMTPEQREAFNNNLAGVASIVDTFSGAGERAILGDKNLTNAQKAMQLTKARKGNAVEGQLGQIRRTERMMQGEDEKATEASTPETRKLRTQIDENEAVISRLERANEERQGGNLIMKRRSADIAKLEETNDALTKTLAALTPVLIALTPTKSKEADQLNKKAIVDEDGAKTNIYNTVAGGTNLNETNFNAGGIKPLIAVGSAAGVALVDQVSVR